MTTSWNGSGKPADSDITGEFQQTTAVAAGTDNPGGMQAGDLPGLLRSCGIRAKKSLSQNFLVSEGVLERIADLVAESSSRTIEIGAGPALLTVKLGNRLQRVVAYELDERFRVLHQRLTFADSVEMLYGDFLEAPLEEITAGGEAWSVIGNIPYAITGLILRRLLTPGLNIQTIYLLVQDEVARRLTAGSGRDSGMATVFAWLFGDVRIAFRVRPGSFLPAPRVNSAFIVLNRIDRGIAADEHQDLAEFIHAAFAARRKTLANSLSLGYNREGGTEFWRQLLQSVGVDPRVRAEVLGAEELLRIFRLIRGQI